MRRYCDCGRPIWVVLRQTRSGDRSIFYDDGEANVWMPITACPRCGATLDAAALEAYRPTLLLPVEDAVSPLLAECQ